MQPIKATYKQWRRQILATKGGHLSKLKRGSPSRMEHAANLRARRRYFGK